MKNKGLATRKYCKELLGWQRNWETRKKFRKSQMGEFIKQDGRLAPAYFSRYYKYFDQLLSPSICSADWEDGKHHYFHAHETNFSLTWSQLIVEKGMWVYRIVWRIWKLWNWVLDRYRQPNWRFYLPQRWCFRGVAKQRTVDFQDVFLPPNLVRRALVYWLTDKANKEHCNKYLCLLRSVCIHCIT